MYRMLRTSCRPPPMVRWPRSSPPVAVQRRQAGELGDLLSIELSQLRQVDDQLVGRIRSDARNRIDDLALVVPVIVGLDLFGDLAIQILDLLLDEPQKFFRLGSGE